MQQSATLKVRPRLARPSFVAFVAALLIATLLTSIPGGEASAQSTRLKDVARPGLSVGAVLHSYDPAWDDGQYIQVAGEEFNAVTATAYMPWGPWPNPNGPIDTTPLGDVIEWAQNRPQPIPVHAHGLVYPLANQSLNWWNNLQPGSGDHERLLKQYVDTMASAHAGDIWVWDVVNEVFADEGNHPSNARDADGLRTSYDEYIEIGPDYVEKAFRWAKDADPNALLIFNDYGIAEMNQKSDNLLAYATKLRDRGVPIDGIGFQMHFQGHLYSPDYQSIRQNLARFAAAGFRLFITELDVMAADVMDADGNGAPDRQPTAAELQQQKSVYAEIARIASEQPAVESLLMWDFADNRSWLHPITTDGPIGGVVPGRYTFPAPWSDGAVGESLTKKPAYDGLIEGLRTVARQPDPNAGPHRLTAAWEPTTANLARSGDLFPGDGVDLAIEGVRGDQWTIEAASDAGAGWFRLRNTWGANDGYLTRDLHPLQVEWTSQLWRFEPIDDGYYRIRNGWEPDSGVLMRNGVPNGNGGYDAGATVSLYTQVDAWTSQRWSTQPVVQPIDCQLGETQAESGQLNGAMTRFSDSNAGGSAYVDAAVGTRNNRTAPNAANAVEICALVDSPGRYRVDARVIAPNSGADSFWVSVDDGTPALWHIRRTTSWTTRTAVDVHRRPATRTAFDQVLPSRNRHPTRLGDLGRNWWFGARVRWCLR